MLKALSFGEIVNVTLGLPIVRTSVDHGTALALAGTGRARPDSLFAAVELALAARSETRVRAKKRLGQHFLHDPAVIRRLVDAIRPQPDDTMVEIGGGPGALTIPLCEKLERLHVVEVDRELAAALPSRVAHPERLVVHEADALDVRLRRARDRAALAARRRQPALQHLDAAAVSSARRSRPSSRICT